MSIAHSRLDVSVAGKFLNDRNRNTCHNHPRDVGVPQAVKRNAGWQPNLPHILQEPPAHVKIGELFLSSTTLVPHAEDEVAGLRYAGGVELAEYFQRLPVDRNETFVAALGGELGRRFDAYGTRFEINGVPAQRGEFPKSEMVDRYQRMFMRSLRALRDLRRYTPRIMIHNQGQVNIGQQQVNQVEAGK